MDEPKTDPYQGYALVVSEMIQSRRRSLGMSQGELARRLGVTPASVSYFESAKRVPALGTFFKLKQVLHMSTRDCFKLLEAMNKCQQDSQSFQEPGTF